MPMIDRFMFKFVAAGKFPAAPEALPNLATQPMDPGWSRSHRLQSTRLKAFSHVHTNYRAKYFTGQYQGAKPKLRERLIESSLDQLVTHMGGSVTHPVWIDVQVHILSMVKPLSTSTNPSA